MGLFKSAPPDPKDEIIQVLKEERDYLRRKLEERDAQFLALTSTHAYRLVHPEEKVDPPASLLPSDPYSLKGADYRPPFSLLDAESHFKLPID